MTNEIKAKKLTKKDRFNQLLEIPAVQADAELVAFIEHELELLANKNKAKDGEKKLTEKQRYQLRPIIEKEALAWAVGVVTPQEIDKINILNASFLAMHRALDKLALRPEYILVDGNRFKPYQSVPYSTVVKGDGKYLSIAAASILAKTYRDDYMNALHQEYPMYDWLSNKGYPTKKHREAIRRFGTSPYHRMSYNLLGDGQLTLEF